MALHLQNLRTGETHPLNPHRTLIGTAPHVTIRTADGGPYLAALVVRYPGGWGLHGLCDDPGVTFNREPLQAAQQVIPRPGDLLTVGDDRFGFVSPRTAPADFPADDDPPPTCFVYVRGPDGIEECRLVDHDLLFGRLPVCHVRFPDTRLSRLAALLATHDGMWFVHTLAKGPIACNRELVEDFVPVEDGDEVQIGPLWVRVEMREPGPGAAPPARFEATNAAYTPPVTPKPELGPAATDAPAGTVETAPEVAGPEPVAFRSLSAAQRLEHWLKDQRPTPPPQAGGLAGWFGAQRQRLSQFWYDTPETSAARSMRGAGKMDEAFAVLDRAIRARPDSPALLRELYRLYEAVGLTDLCYRPLRQIEKLAAAGGGRDTWVLETLAKVCERLGNDRPAMFERAISYWNKLESVTGVSYARERSAAMAARALRQGGYAGTAGDGS